MYCKISIFITSYFFNKLHFVYDIKNACTDIFLVSDIYDMNNITLLFDFGLGIIPCVL